MLDITSGNKAQLKAALSKVAELDANLGGDWWHEVQRKLEGKELVARIRDGYVERVLNAAGEGWSCFKVAVSDSLGASPIYDLLLFTQHPQGMWFFNDAVSLARRIFQTYCEPDAVLRPPLFEPDDEWVATIKGNLRWLLRGDRSVRVIDSIGEVYGAVLGIARGTHVKNAARQLAAEGVNSGDYRVDPHQLVLVPAPRPTARPA
jgi:hypothetical protein